MIYICFLPDTNIGLKPDHYNGPKNVTTTLFHVFTLPLTRLVDNKLLNSICNLKLRLRDTSIAQIVDVVISSAPKKLIPRK